MNIETHLQLFLFGRIPYLIFRYFLLYVLRVVQTCSRVKINE